MLFQFYYMIRFIFLPHHVRRPVTVLSLNMIAGHLDHLNQETAAAFDD